jgi:hypothetical protein
MDVAPVPDGRWPMRRAPRRGVVCKTRPPCGIESPALAMSLGETQWRLSGEASAKLSGYANQVSEVARCPKRRFLRKTQRRNTRPRQKTRLEGVKSSTL